MTTRSVPTLLALAVIAAGCSGGDAEEAQVANFAPPDPIVTAPPTVASTTATTTPATTSTTVPPTTSTTTSTTSTTSTTTTTLPPIPRQPLTGGVLADGDEPIDRPALVVKIDNAPPARSNQSGLALADVVFEEIVEGDITRFAAVFHSRDADLVGPIRSGRTQDIDLFASFDTPLFAWSGGNPGVTELIANGPFIDLNAVGDGEGYFRGAGRAPHNLYNSTERLWAQTPADHGGLTGPQFRYVRPDEPFGGSQVVGFELGMRAIDVEWRWDGGRGQFVRFQEGGPHIDASHGSIGANNVVVMVVEYRPSVVDARSPEAQTVGQGPAFLFARGRVIEARWWRTSADDPIKFVALDGVTPLGLVPGNTWVELAEARIVDSLLTATTDIAIEPLG